MSSPCSASINHNRISKAKGDEDFTAPGETNTYFDSMVQQMSRFIDQNIVSGRE